MDVGVWGFGRTTHARCIHTCTHTPTPNMTSGHAGGVQDSIPGRTLVVEDGGGSSTLPTPLSRRLVELQVLCHGTAVPTLLAHHSPTPSTVHALPRLALPCIALPCHAMPCLALWAWWRHPYCTPDTHTPPRPPPNHVVSTSAPGCPVPPPYSPSSLPLSPCPPVSRPPLARKHWLVCPPLLATTWRCWLGKLTAYLDCCRRPGPQWRQQPPQ